MDNNYVIHNIHAISFYENNYGLSLRSEIFTKYNVKQEEDLEILELN